MNLKTLIRTRVAPAVRRAAKTVSKATTAVLKRSKKSSHELTIFHLNTRSEKLFHGSFRFHYNWCSSHVVPFEPQTYGSYNGGESEDGDGQRELDVNVKPSDGSNGDVYEDIDIDIDLRAEVFIKKSHERFRLEKVDSYRRFQDMLARE